MTNNEFYKTVYKPYQEQHMTKGTRRTRCQIIENRLLSKHGNKTPDDVSYLDIERIYDAMEREGLKQNTLFGTYAALYSFFRMAVNHGEAEGNSVKYARTIRADIVRRN